MAIKAVLIISSIAVMNYTEMEAKVREATNNNPWGSSTTVTTPPSSAQSALPRLRRTSTDLFLIGYARDCQWHIQLVSFPAS